MGGVEREIPLPVEVRERPQQPGPGLTARLHRGCLRTRLRSLSRRGRGAGALQGGLSLLSQRSCPERGQLAAQCRRSPGPLLTEGREGPTAPSESARRRPRPPVLMWPRWPRTTCCSSELLAGKLTSAPSICPRAAAGLYKNKSIWARSLGKGLAPTGRTRQPAAPAPSRTAELTLARRGRKGDRWMRQRPRPPGLAQRGCCVRAGLVTSPRAAQPRGTSTTVN